jgi:hypothetical protein
MKRILIALAIVLAYLNGFSQDSNKKVEIQSMSVTNPTYDGGEVAFVNDVLNKIDIPKGKLKILKDDILIILCTIDSTGYINSVTYDKKESTCKDIDIINLILQSFKDAPNWKVDNRDLIYQPLLLKIPIRFNDKRLKVKK